MTDDSETAVGSVDPAALLDRLEAGDPVTLLDIRDRTEVEAWRIDHPSAVNVHVPYARFLSAKVTDSVEDLLDFERRGRLVVVCPRGQASREVAGILREAGVEADNLAGGMEAWGRLYRRREVGDGVYQYQRPATGCLAYLVVDGGEALVVDPLRAFTDRYRADAADLGADLVYAVDTHLHADHLSGVRDLAAAGAEATLPEGTVERGFAGGVETLADGDELAVGERTVRAVALPGHTTDMTGFALDGLLLSGDSLFLDAVARIDLQEAGADTETLARELYRTLHERLGAFDDGTLVCPGHFGGFEEADEAGRFVATLGALRERVAAFDRPEADFVARLTGEQPPQPANFERIVAINLGESDTDSEEAADLELGPNNCAAAAD
ncbi:MAG: MBL fold metallo-hydrolase [Haloarculaceae archaeon]